ncbi:probable glutamate receptor isoform X2 [Venturia canescens]|nr:probable glutamate receptor isoform X2 [Venturia canescens]
MINTVNTTLGNEFTKYTDDEKPLEIKVTTWQDMPYSGTVNESGKLVGVGYAFEVLHLAQRKLNFTYTIVLPETNSIGDNTTGMMLLLYQKKVDMAVAFIPVLENFFHLCEFSSIQETIPITFMMVRPLESATGQGILAPFSDIVWYYILGSWIIFGPIMYILIWCRSKVPDGEKHEAYSFPTCVWFTYGALLKQGTTTEPDTNSTRLIFATWWIFITILTSFYTANLTAFLTLSEFTLPFNSACDIRESGKHWVTVKDQVMDVALKQDQSDLLKPLRDSKDLGRVSFIDNTNFVKIVEWMKNGYLFVGDRYFIVKEIAKDYQERVDQDQEEKKRCPYVMQPKNIYELTRAFAFPLKSAFKDIINKHLMYISELGIVKHLQTDGTPGVPICPLNLKSKERQLRNRDLLMTYKAMAIGFGSAGIFFIFEVLIKWLSGKNNCNCCSDLICYRSKIETPVVSMSKTNKSNEAFEFSKPNPNLFSHFENVYPDQRVKRSVVNGREYWVVTEKDGEQRLVPIRTPSALLFHHSRE